MLVVRAWPDDPPAGRPHVVDGWRRVPVNDYDYRPLCSLGCDVVSMDWDTAVGREDLRQFAATAAASPARVLVAPVRNYRAEPPPWNLVRYGETGNYDPVAEGEAAHLFGFGLVYLPAALLAAWDADHGAGAKMTDQAFAAWHHETVSAEVGVCWAVRPVHLHYPESASGQRGGWA